MKSFTCFKTTILDLKEKAEKVLSSSPPMFFNCIPTDKINLLKPEHNPIYRMFLIWEPSNNPGASVFSSNLEDGWYTFVNILSTKHFFDSASIRLSPPDNEDPICEFLTYTEGKQNRIVRVMKDDSKWEFYEEGKAYNFEEIENYTRRLKRQRFTQEMLTRYMKNLGWDIEDKDFYKTETFGLLFEETKP
jgi:hypothetical protein